MKFIDFSAANRVCESRQEFVLTKVNGFVYRWYTSLWSPSNMQTDAAFIKQIGCTSRVWAMFKNDRIIVKTGLAWCPETRPHGSAALYALNRHSVWYLHKGLSWIKVKWSLKIRTVYSVVIGCNYVVPCLQGKQAFLCRLLSHPLL